MRIIENALEKLNEKCGGFDILQQKDGVTVARLHRKEGSRILKCFSGGASCREITNYRLLGSLGIPTLRVIKAVSDAFIMEDIASSAALRLGEERDMASPGIARALAGWYRLLHDNGRAYAAENGGGLYSEYDMFTAENIARVRRLSDTGGLNVWRALEAHTGAIAAFMRSLPVTLSYNDFYYTNMAVARDGGSAMMFDYNLLGRGYVYSDLRNVTYSLSPEAGEAFMEAYGGFDPREALLDDVVSPIVTLHMAFQREVFPEWGRQALDEFKNSYHLRLGALVDALE